jgi:penicillin-binding protein 1C
MWDVSGVSGAAPVWRDVMDFLHRERPGKQGAAPAALVRKAVAFQPAHEPAREEWFLRGTDTTLVEAVPAARRTPKIVYPVDGSIVAVDPDIPDRLERMLFQAQGVGEHRWRLDGLDVGPAGEGLAWQPVVGEHRLELVDAAGKAVSTSRFEVRGN